MEFCFHLVQFRIKTGLYPENCPTEDQKLAHDADGGIRDLARRRNEEQANGGDGNTSGKAGYGYASLELGQFYAFLLVHKALIVTYEESKDERIVAGVLEAHSPGLASENTILDMGFTDAIHGRIVLVAPAVLTENFFMDSHPDCAFLLSEEGQQAIVDLHVTGITAYLL